MEDAHVQAEETSEDAFDDTSDEDDSVEVYKVRNWASDDSDEDYEEEISW